MIKKLLIIGGLYTMFFLFRKAQNRTDEQIDYMARTIWGEARGEGARGMQAVANVIMNRVNKGGWYGATIKDVVLKKWQFSVWNEGDPNRDKILNATQAQLAQALDISKKVIKGELQDITGGATNYHATTVKPSWAAKMTKTVQIGNHVFYRE